ncbi:unnamed protein product [Ilex paraguariensis]|uniref:Uncharacterized protein n=1 Tax=Ilex paraguariensis TaxID=185542 RepID=A0ABC8R6T1_9AQUA
MEECKKSGQIPAFGDWDTANDLPITQYFECPRQAGLIRFSGSDGCATRDRYAVDFIKPPLCSAAVPVPPQKRKQVKVCDVKEQPRKQPLSNTHKHFPKHSDKAGGGHITRKQTATTTTYNVKAVDEDLYKIPPELLYTSKRKKKLGFFSRCLVPDCMV